MEFRKLSITDLDAYYECRLQALQDTPDAFLTTYAEEKARGNQFFKTVLSADHDRNIIFGALENGKVVGTAGIFQEDRPKSRRKASIWGMFVDPAHRGKGIGKKLVQLAIEHAKEKMKVSVIGLSVESSNENAKRLYLNAGFKPWGTEPRAMSLNGKFFDEIHMALLF